MPARLHKPPHASVGLLAVPCLCRRAGAAQKLRHKTFTAILAAILHEPAFAVKAGLRVAGRAITGFSLSSLKQLPVSAGYIHYILQQAMSLPSIHKIVIFRALQLGDMLCAIPAVRLLRRYFPQAGITIAGLPWAKELVSRYPHYFNEHLVFPGYPGLPEQPLDVSGTLHFMQRMAVQQYDLALQMQGNGSVVNPMVFLWGAKHTAGFYRKEDYYPGELFLEYPDNIHEIERHLLLIAHVYSALKNKKQVNSDAHSKVVKPTFTIQDMHLEFPVTGADKAELATLQLPLLPRQYVCIHPGSRGAWRQWPPEYFARLANRCAAAGLQVVLTGTNEERALTGAVKQYMKHPVIDLTGHTSLGAMGALLQDAFLLVANCTGVSHIAAALETPSVIISMDGEPQRWAPLNQTLHPTIDWTTTPDIRLAENALEQLLQQKI